MEGLIGRKLGMTQLFSPEGEVLAVTVVEAGPCTVVQRKLPKRDGYSAVQLGYGEQKERRVTKPLRGHFGKAGSRLFRVLREFRVPAELEAQPGQEVRVDIFRQGDRVDVTGISKGRGFQGVQKRHGFAGGPGSHGSMFNRAPGSIGSNTFPGRVFKGKRLPGHMGAERVTTQGVRVVGVDRGRNLLLLHGAVPGAREGLLLIRRSGKARRGPAA